MLNISYISGPKNSLEKAQNNCEFLIISGPITPIENCENQKGTTPQINYILYISGPTAY